MIVTGSGYHLCQPSAERWRVSFLLIGDRYNFLKTHTQAEILLVLLTYRRKLKGLSHGSLSDFEHRQNYRYNEGKLKIIYFTKIEKHHRDDNKP